MGGFGSGRDAEYRTVEEARLMAWSMKEVLKRYRGRLPDFSPSVDLYCRASVGPHHLVCAVPLCWKGAGYGPRPYFACPHCDEACSILYPVAAWPAGEPPRTKYWGCRRCAGLVYASQSRGRTAQASGRYERIAYQLDASLFDVWPLVLGAMRDAGWEMPPSRLESSDQLPEAPQRPRYMRKAKYQRLVYQWTLAGAQRQAAQTMQRHCFALRTIRFWQQDHKRWQSTNRLGDQAPDERSDLSYPGKVFTASAVAAVVKGREDSERELEELVVEWRTAMRTPAAKK